MNNIDLPNRKPSIKGLFDSSRVFAQGLNHSKSFRAISPKILLDLAELASVVRRDLLLQGIREFCRGENHAFAHFLFDHHFYSKRDSSWVKDFLDKRASSLRTQPHNQRHFLYLENFFSDKRIS